MNYSPWLLTNKQLSGSVPKVSGYDLSHRNFWSHPACFQVIGNIVLQLIVLMSPRSHKSTICLSCLYSYTGGLISYSNEITPKPHLYINVFCKPPSWWKSLNSVCQLFYSTNDRKFCFILSMPHISCLYLWYLYCLKII